MNFTMSQSDVASAPDVTEQPSVASNSVAGRDDRSAPEMQRRSSRKIVALIPAGETYDKTSVRSWTHADPVSDVKQHYNAGDMFVHEASLRLLDFADVESVHLEANWDQRTVDRLNEEADYCFIRGSNYIHHEMKWGTMPGLLEKLKIPVVAFGIGAQAPIYKDVKVSADTLRVLNIVAERSKSVGVRGAFSAEVIAGLGIKNVEVVGCPSLMRHNRPSLNIRVGDLADVRRVGFTLTRGLFPMYCQDVAKAREMQRAMMLDYAERFDLTIMSQGERPERAYWYNYAPDVAAAYQTLLADKWFTGPDDPLVDLYRTRMFFGTSPAAYEEMVKRRDLVVGFRLHGNIMALANEVPAIYIVYDSRTRELAEYLKIPSYDIMDKEPFTLEQFHVQDRFDQFNAQYREAYRRMAQFLDANGVPHLMRP
jgi:Polysaccharide pyruvyl transferase